MSLGDDYLAAYESGEIGAPVIFTRRSELPPFLGLTDDEGECACCGEVVCVRSGVIRALPPGQHHFICSACARGKLGWNPPAIPRRVRREKARNN